MLGLPNQGGLLAFRCDPVIGAYPVQRRVTPNRLLGLRDRVFWFERGAAASDVCADAGAAPYGVAQSAVQKSWEHQHSAFPRTWSVRGCALFLGAFRGVYLLCCLRLRRPRVMLVFGSEKAGAIRDWSLFGFSCMCLPEAMCSSE